MEQQPNLLGFIHEQNGKISLQELRQQTLSCSSCSLRAGCTQVVFGEGNPRAELMLIGEGPGGDEDRIGHPFVGAAGRLLDKILDAAKISRKEIFIDNIVKCRPPRNRVPAHEEIKICLSILKQQIEIISPKIILCLGATAARSLISPGFRITRQRGHWYRQAGIYYTATFHPAALLRDSSKKIFVWEDIQAVRDFYRGGETPPLSS